MKRTSDPHVIEQRLLEMVYTTDAMITSPALAYFATCSLQDAEKVLDDLVARDRIRMEVSDDGTITYVFPGRGLGRLPRVASPPALVRQVERPLAPRRHTSPALAALLSVCVPGAGQLYSGNPLSAVLWFLIVGAGYTLILPGLILHVFCVVSAAGAARRSNMIGYLQLEGG
jgi:TM2 domain-containing membrane protein YozV